MPTLQMETFMYADISCSGLPVVN